jgi:hypothetical protein
MFTVEDTAGSFVVGSVGGGARVVKAWECRRGQGQAVVVVVVPSFLLHRGYECRTSFDISSRQMGALESGPDSDDGLQVCRGGAVVCGIRIEGLYG